MNFNFENNLEIYGEKEDLQKFFIDNASENSILSFKNIIPEDDNNLYLLEGGMYDGDDLYYSFLTEGGAPLNWIRIVGEKYNRLEFYMVYQSKEMEESGEIIYKNGKLYHNCRYNSEDEIIENNVITI